MYLKIRPAIKFITFEEQMTILQNYYVKTFEDVKLQIIQFYLLASLLVLKWTKFCVCCSPLHFTEM